VRQDAVCSESLAPPHSHTTTGRVPQPTLMATGSNKRAASRGTKHARAYSPTERDHLFQMAGERYAIPYATLLYSEM